MIVLISLTTIFHCDLLDSVTVNSPTGTPTETETVEALKTALKVGIDSASSEVSQINGYLQNELIRILLPGDVVEVLEYTTSLKEKLNTVPFVSFAFDFSSFLNIEDTLRVALNRAAEHAAPLSVDIFVSEITAMTISDGMTILLGDSVAATTYLKENTFTSLVGVYQPFVDSTLGLVGANTLWSTFAQQYNALHATYTALPTLVKETLPQPPFDTLTMDLATYTTQKALHGLFVVVGQEETKIRTDPVARVYDILEKVFDWLDTQKESEQPDE